MTDGAQYRQGSPASGPGAVRISVIVPIHDVAAHVQACIRSILTQEFTDFELIAVDDGSTDGSGDLAMTAAAGDPRFRLLRQDNGGLAAARNTGLDAAQGALVCFVDSDDRIAPDYLLRLEGALVATQADWVACAIRFCPEDGSAPFNHSALHGAPNIDEPPRPVRYDMTDWCEVVRHFPSAWNKIYRRDLIGDLRFDPGLNYEDHAFFYRYACRTDHLVHLHAPLYLSTQGRPGQITRDGSERVFEQFQVLDTLQAIVADSAKENGATALARVVTRLTFERSEAITDPERRARFLAQARRALGGRPVDDALGVPAFWVSLLNGVVPVSVVIPSDGNIAALEETLAALARRTLHEAEILVVADGAPAREAIADPATRAGARVLTAPDPQPQAMADRVAAARNAGLAAAQGETLVFLDAGDTLPPRALAIWHNRLRRAGADLGFARFITAPDAGHTGLHDRRGLDPRLEDPAGFVPEPGDALFIHAHPSAKIFDTAFLREGGLTFAAGPLSSWQMLFQAVGQAGRILYLPGPPPRLANGPETRRLWRAPVPARDLAAAVDAIAALCPAALPPAAQGRLLVRAIWEKINFADFPDDAARAAFEEEARATFSARFQSAGLLQGAHAGLLPDPYVGERLRDLLALGREGQHT